MLVSKKLFLFFFVEEHFVCAVAIFSIFVFSLILICEKQHSNMFKYLLLNAINDAIQFVIQSFAPLFYTNPSTYASQVWFIGFYYSVESVNELSSGFFELAATFDCMITINRKFDCCKKKLFFYVTGLAIFVYSSLFYVFFLLRFKISKMPTANLDAAKNTAGGHRILC